MKEIYEKILSIILNRICLVVGISAMLPVMVGWLVFNFWLYKLFMSEGVVLSPYVSGVLAFGFSCLSLVLLLFFTSVMEGFDKSLKNMYHEVKIKNKELEK